jgi:hypothetical protein
VADDKALSHNVLNHSTPYKSLSTIVSKSIDRCSRLWYKNYGMKRYTDRHGNAIVMLQVYIPVEQRMALQEIAKQQRRTLSAMATIIMGDYLQNVIEEGSDAERTTAPAR